MGKLEELIKQEQQLKHRIQLEKNKLNAVAGKRRDGKLIAWGVAVEQLLAHGAIIEEWWEMQFNRVLSGITLKRALVG